MNVSQIKTARAKAAGEIFDILKKLEHETGMMVAGMDVDFDIDDDGHNTGAESVTINLELE